MRRLMLAAAICASAATAGHAADECDGNEMTQTALNECFGRAYETADKELNGVYRLVSHRLDGSPDAKKLMIASQKA